MKVIKVLSFTMFMLAISTTVQAQKVGVRAGINISNVSGDADTKPLTGFYAGVFKEITLVPELVYLQPELQYSMQGYKVEDTKVSIG